ncbi:MAG: hypothetical protein QXU98_02340, partial [Candidatus Parvarchaeota archaeon]
SALEKVKTYGTLMVVALLVPLLISFVIWIVGSAFSAGGGMAPGITYGIYQITSSTPGTSSYNIASGVSYFWINSAANGGIASSPAFPTVMVTIMNDLISLIALAVAIFLGIEFAASLLQVYGARR